MAFSAVTALVAGEVTAVTVLAAVAEVGTAMTVVGAVTGDKELMKIGGTMGLVGGLGSMAAGALGGAAAADAGSMTVTDAATASSNVANSLDGFEAANSATSGLSDAATVGGAIPTPDVTGSALPGADSSPFQTPDSVQQAAQGAQPNQPPAPVAPDPIAVQTPVTGTPADTGIQTPASAGTPSVSTPSGPAGTTSGGSGMGSSPGNAPATYSSGTPGQSAGGFWGQVQSFFKDPANKALTDTGLKFGLGALQGAANGQFNQARIDLARQQQTWGNSVGSTARTTGIINGARA